MLRRKKIESKRGIPAASMYLGRYLKGFLSLKRMFTPSQKPSGNRLGSLWNPFKRRKEVHCRFISPHAFFPDEQMDSCLKRVPKVGQLIHLEGNKTSYLLIRKIPKKSREFEHKLGVYSADDSHRPEYLFEVIEYRKKGFF